MPSTPYFSFKETSLNSVTEVMFAQLHSCPAIIKGDFIAIVIYFCSFWLGEIRGMQLGCEIIKSTSKINKQCDSWQLRLQHE